MGTKSDSEGEFEDAMDMIQTKVNSSVALNPAFRDTVINNPSTSTAFTSELFQNAGDATLKNVSRHGRLAILRNRMKAEFGTGGGPMFGDDDNSQSDCTSIASWGHNLLMEQRQSNMIPLAVPDDSLSTRATPARLSEIPSPTDESLPTTPCSPDKDKGTTSQTEPIIEHETKTDNQINKSTVPPVMPPPPLPPLAMTPNERRSSAASDSGDRPNGSVRNIPAMPAPPPLPPRRTTVIPKLPSALPDIQNSSPKRNIKAIENLKKTPTPETSSPYDNYGKKRGHAKTNSLDRGLSLAKSMKSGPFPPPSDVVAAAKEVTCEEDQRINTAHGVIQQLTFSVLANPMPESDLVKNSAEDDEQKVRESYTKYHVRTTSAGMSGKYPSHGANKELASVGEEGSCSAPSVASTPVRSPVQIPKMYITPHYENLTLEHEKNENDSQPTPSTSQIENHSEKSERTTPGEQMDLDENKRKTKSLESGQSLNKLTHTDSIDPVTRDVQRRVSMLSKERNEDRLSSTSTQNEDDSLSLTSRTGIKQAQAIARSYGSAASGLIKGAVQRAKTAVSFNRASKNLPTKEDEGENESDSDDEGTATSTSDHANVKTAQSPAICRPKNLKKGPFDFENLRVIQELNNEHTGAIWCIKFSMCGRLFATAGQDNIIRVWVLRNHLGYFTRMRERYSLDARGLDDKHQSSMHDFENLRIQEDDLRSDGNGNFSSNSPSEEDVASTSANSDSAQNSTSSAVVPKPFCVFRGHTADVLDLSWSPRNYFLLSSSIDRTVKLWHLTRNECLCCFQHMDFVTCIAFMPKDRYFISGSLDGKIRLWHIPEKKVALWNEVEQVKFITAITFVRNGKFVVVGTYNGRCFFYSSDQLKYHTVIDVRSSRGKNARGHKITSLAVHGDKLLITSNDSRIRIYDLRDMKLTCKFKGAQIEHSQIRASFSPDGRYIISGSEDNFTYIWKTTDLPTSISVRKDRNNMWERIRAHNCVVTAAVFAPKPHLFQPLLDDNAKYSNAKESTITPRNLVSKPISARTEGLESRFKFNEFPNVDQPIILGGNQSSFSNMKSITSNSLRSIDYSTPNSKAKEVHSEIIISADLNGFIKVMSFVRNFFFQSVRNAHTYSRDVLEKLNLDKGPYRIDRAWWNSGRSTFDRYCYWTNWVMQRDYRHRAQLANRGEDRLRFKAMTRCTTLPQAIRDEFQEKLNKFPAHCHPKRIYNMCMFTGAKRGKIKRYRVNRYIFRRMADHGQLCGVQRSMFSLSSCKI
ncbi:WD domain, g-beta repeat domain-containing protein [Ditylenchus destructor]|nr:WD domain, g-beta repeat domain-containing protein [Ditylenchus destructor]